jgi:glycosyltransferase involved in cell wall biosynthesis
MKIGIDIRLIGKKRTGDEVVFFNLVKNLAEINDSRFTFKLFTDITEKDTLDGIRQQLGIVGKENFEIISLPAKNKFAWNFWALPKYLRKNPLDIYQTQYITPLFVPKNIKIITIIHDISFNFFPQFIKKSDLFFLKTLIPMSLKRADMIIGVSRFTRDEIIKYYKTDPKKVECIYNSVNDDFLKKEISTEKLSAVREKYKLPEKFILYIGTLQPRKNIRMLIEAYAKTKNQLGALGLVICGSRQAHNYDKKIDVALVATKLEKVIIFPGFVDETDKVAIFRLSHAFVFPSFYEGFGVPVLEAISQGVPVLASDIPSLKEIAGNGALYFNPASLDEFSQMLYDVCMDEGLRAKLIQSGKERVSFFSWKKSARQTLALYEKLSYNIQNK